MECRNSKPSLQGFKVRESLFSSVPHEEIMAGSISRMSGPEVLSAEKWRSLISEEFLWLRSASSYYVFQGYWPYQYVKVLAT